MPAREDTETTRAMAERRIIGVLVQNPERAHDLFDRIPNADYFQDKRYAQIFSHAKEIHKDGRTISVLALTRQFQTKGNIPPSLQLTLTDAMQDAQSYPGVIEECAEIIVNEKHLTEFKCLAGRAQSVADALAASHSLLEWTAADSSPDESPWSQVIDETLERQRRIKAGEVSAGYSWGLPELDRHVLLQPEKLYVLGGIKKGAKTIFTLAALRENLTRKPPIPTLLFSLEMSRHEIARKILSSLARIDSRKIFTPFLGEKETDELARHGERAKQFPLTVNDGASLRSHQILSRTLRWKFRNEIPDGTGIVVVDFLQLVELDRQRSETEASGIKRLAFDLARMAKELKVAVIAVAQLRNESEGEKPHLRFLEGSGGIAQAAEAIILVDLVHRRQGEHDGNWPADFNVIVSAQRTGESGITIPCKCDLPVGEFRGVSIYDG